MKVVRLTLMGILGIKIMQIYVGIGKVMDNYSSQLLFLHLLSIHIQAQGIMGMFVLFYSFKRKIFGRNTAVVHDNKRHGITFRLL